MIALLIAAALTAEPPLLAVLERARVEVPDGREIADLQICPLDRRGNALLALSRPREARRYYRVVWHDGRPLKLDDLNLTGTDDGLKGLAVRTLERRFEACRWVSPAELAAAWAQLDAR
jgi:hypothetical protein